jgi:hypothetical protein
MFNLDQEISEWRRRMSTEGIQFAEVLDELESHLRDDIERQMRSGIEARCAFETAIEQIGKSGVLNTEFKKISGISPPLEKLMIAACLVFIALIVALGTLTVILCFATWEERAMASAAMTCTILVACGWGKAVPFLPVIASKAKRRTIGLICIACGFGASSFYCEVILPRFEISADRQIPAIGFWAVFLIAIFACAGLGLMMSEDERELWRMKRSPIGG